MNISLSQVMKQKLNDKKDTNPDTHMITSRLMKG